MNTIEYSRPVLTRSRHTAEALGTYQSALAQERPEVQVVLNGVDTAEKRIVVVGNELKKYKTAVLKSAKGVDLGCLFLMMTD